MRPKTQTLTLLCLLLCLLFETGWAQTPVSGILNGTHTWTTAGSPYLIQSHLYVNGTVDIQPGVEVLFQGSYKIEVNGYLKAVGTAQDPITFASFDTTGFSDPNTNVGGWQGITFDYYITYDPNDISEFKHCIIRDVKLRGFVSNTTAAILSSRGMEITHCEFYNNWCEAGSGEIVKVFTTGNSRDAVLRNCNFHHNISYYNVVRFNHSGPGLARVQDCSFKHNTGGNAVWTHGFPDMLIERNEVDSNACNRSRGMIATSDCHGRVGDNHVTHNDLYEQAALRIRGGLVTIEKNLITNNNSYANLQFCGPAEGGGGIHLSGGSPLPDSLKKHVVRDNIIANNSTGAWGGGIYVYDIDAVIHNNTVMYNGCHYFGPSIYAVGDRHLYIHNNLFTGNFSTFAWGATFNHINVSASLSAFAYDYNYSIHDFSTSVSYFGNNFVGDSTHCLSNGGAHLINPPTSGLIWLNAADKDYRLSDSSLCINAGIDDSLILGAALDAFDFAYDDRVSGGLVDIGAHEFQFTPPCTDTTIIQTVSACGAFTWIDGNTYTQNNDSASVSFVTAQGCDSTLLLDLTIHSSFFSVQSIDACESYTWIDGNTYTESNDSATVTYTNIHGCDSTVQLDLTIHQPTSSVQSFTECGAFTWIDGNTYTQSNNTATATFTGSNGCDSTVHLDLTIHSVQAGIAQAGRILNASPSGAQYQWLDCNNSMAPIAGEVAATYHVPSSGGSFAVAVTLKECSDTSACVQLEPITSVNDIRESTHRIKVFPNPAQHHIFIEGTQAMASIQLHNAMGQLVLEEKGNAAVSSTLDLNVPAGYYLLNIRFVDGKMATTPLIIQE